MKQIIRSVEVSLLGALKRGKSVLLLGPRQTGKTTLITKLKSDLYLNLARPDNRMRYEAAPQMLEAEILALSKGSPPLILLDEIQKVPRLLDLAQDLIDRKVAQFVFTGSSARKLRRESELNLLPGRVIELRMFPLMLSELDPMPALDSLLMDGSLPEVVNTAGNNERDELLASYVATYLEEEIRQEAIVRKLGAFVRFLELAAGEAGYEINAQKISQSLGVAQTTVQGYYEILADCLIAERIDAFVPGSTRRRLAKSPKFIFFDLGVRRFAAHEGRQPSKQHFGRLFEQFVGIELVRLLRNIPERPRLYHWRDYDGPEVDWVVELDGLVIPIKVKAAESVTLPDCRHLKTFLDEHENTRKGFVICRTPRAVSLTDQITAIPWFSLRDGSFLGRL